MKYETVNICILNYGFGNTGSVKNMLKKLGVTNIELSSNPEEILKASHLIIPGVGSFDNAMKKIKSLNLDNTIKAFVNSGRPLLGICLGMQILGLSSEEGSENGLGLIPFINVRFRCKEQRVPHMGWNQIDFSKEVKLTTNLTKGDRFYFVHSYHASKVPSENILFTTIYEEKFVSGVIHENIIGVQFHPEKSHIFGLNLLKGFIEYNV
jgi:glutamine amidotransferase